MNTVLVSYIERAARRQGCHFGWKVPRKMVMKIDSIEKKESSLITVMTVMILTFLYFCAYICSSIVTPT